MGMQIDKSSYEKLIREDIEWLEANTEHSCERMHIEDVLKCSVCMIYGEQTSLCSRLNCKTPKRMEKEDFKIERGKWYVCIKTFIRDSRAVVREGHVYRSDNGNSIHGDSGRLFLANQDGKAVEYFRHWTIEDAKDGDILHCWSTASSTTFIYDKEKSLEENHIRCYCLYDSEDKFLLGKHHTPCSKSDRTLSPATMDQIELLFSKIRSAGYEWDEEKKQLKEIGKSDLTKEAGNVQEELTEFENALLEIIDFTATAVLKNQKMPKFERMKQLSKEWAVGLIEIARKQM